MQLDRAFAKLAYIDRLKVRLRHLGKIAESSDDIFQIGNFPEQRRRALAESFVELLLALIAGAQKVLYRQLQREERVLKLMRQATREFAPCGYPLSLHQAFAVIQQVAGHSIE